MAHLVDAPPPRSRKTRYPYDDWFVGGWMMLTRGEDFTNDPRSVGNSILTYARRNGIFAKVELRRDKSIDGQPVRFLYVLGDRNRAWDGPSDA